MDARTRRDQDVAGMRNAALPAHRFGGYAAFYAMTEPCDHSQLMRPSIGVVLRQSATCPRCGEPLKLRPDAALAATVLAIGGGSALGGLFGRGSWSAAAATLAGILGLYVVLVLGLVRFFPMRHVSATDSAATTYRVLIAVMLLFCALVIAFAYGMRHGA